MKAVVNNIELKNELSFISSVMKSNKVTPITECVKMEFKSIGSLDIKGTDNESFVITSLKCESKSDFSFCIPFDYLSSLVGVCVGPIEFFLEEKIVTIKSSDSKNKHPVNANDNDIFPSCPHTDDINNISIDADGTFFNYMSTACTFRKKSTDNPIFIGVFMHFLQDGIMVSGCDMQMAFSAKTGIKTIERSAIIVPENFCNLSKKFQESVVVINNNYISASYGSRKILCKLIDQNAAKMETIMIYNTNADAKFDIATLKRAVDTSIVSSTLNIKDVSIVFLDGRVKVVSESIDFGRSSKCEIAAMSKDSIPELNLLGEKLLHCLGCLSNFSEDVCMSVTASDKQVIMFTENDKNILVSLMPLAKV